MIKYKTECARCAVTIVRILGSITDRFHFRKIIDKYIHKNWKIVKWIWKSLEALKAVVPHCLLSMYIYIKQYKRMFCVDWSLCIQQVYTHSPMDMHCTETQSPMSQQGRLKVLNFLVAVQPQDINKVQALWRLYNECTGPSWPYTCIEVSFEYKFTALNIVQIFLYSITMIFSLYNTVTCYHPLCHNELYLRCTAKSKVTHISESQWYLFISSVVIRTWSIMSPVSC